MGWYGRAMRDVEPDFWRTHKERIERGEVLDVFPYDQGRRFHIRGNAPQTAASRLPASNLFNDEI